jgi:formylglycine-generating enzyme required for sulfatase activity
MGLAAFIGLALILVAGRSFGQQQTNGKIGTVVSNSLGMQFAYIAAGEFLMGSPESEPGRGIDELRHRVVVSRPFYLGVTEVTQQQYAQVMSDHRNEFSELGGYRDRVEGLDTRTLPADCVSWEDAQRFCQRLSDIPAEKEAGRVYRLPSEAQWELACRAGSDSLWSFGDDVKSLADFACYNDGTPPRRPHHVGQKKPNQFGLYDMHGNVWEWCQDWYGRDYYRASLLADPLGPPDGTSRVLRGGSWHSPPARCRSAQRLHDPPRVRDASVGLRVLLLP